MSEAHVPDRRRRWRRLLLACAAAIVALALVASATAVWAVRRSFPRYGGELSLPGLTAPVTVYRDAYAIPQVYAQTPADLFRAQGYVHAQERFWEMDFRRHLTAGRLAEMFGVTQLDTDRYIRTLGWRRVAEREWELLAPSTRDNLTAYAAGVNAWLAQHGNGEATGAASLEYTILAARNSDYRIEKWHPVDSLAWLKAMAWDLRGNMIAEMERVALLGSGLRREQVEELFPRYPYERNGAILSGGALADGAFVPQGATAPAAGTAGGAAAVSHLSQELARLPQMLAPAGAGIGSNSWVLAGSRTTTGKPILANDPHLGPTMPGIWFQMGLHCTCSYNVSGYSFSGVPGVVIGHNDRIAWGFTNLGADVTDLYLEQVDGERYRVGEQWHPLEVRHETIKVAGGAAVPLTIRTSEHGPLLSDASPTIRQIGEQADAPGRYAVALRWTALDPGRTMDSVFVLNAARDWTEFRQAAELFEVPAQNMLYADVDGNIGYQAPGRIPLRGKGDGRWPAPGWDPEFRWRSFIPFGELPSAYNPAQGYLVTANQPVVGPSYPQLLTDDWTYGYRGRRINDMVAAAGGKLSTSDMGRMQFDNHNGWAATLAPVLLAAKVPARTAKAQALLRGWDFQEPADGAAGTRQGHSSAAAAYFSAVWRHLLLGVFDELPAAHLPDGSDRWFEVVRGLLDAPDSPWWDDRRTPGVERRDAVLTAAMAAAAHELTQRLGDDPAAWRWGALHQLTLRNQTFGRSGIAAVEWLFNLDPVGTSGSGDAVNATGWHAARSYDVNWVPSMRMVVDLSNMDDSRWVNLTSASGHAFSPHYADQVELWRTGRTLPMRWSRESVKRESRHVLTLRAS